jgi:xylose isomerase
VAFEFISKLGAPYYCWHDRDVAPEGKTLAETNKNFDAVAKVLKEEQKRTGVKLLWGTANAVFQSALCPRREHELQRRRVCVCRRAGEEGDGSDARTRRRRLHVLGRTRRLHDAAQHRHETRAGASGEVSCTWPCYKKQIGFKGQFYIEPKPKEPTKHQYDSDAAACLNFLREYDLLPHFKLNIETNHATLAGHTMQHELEVAGAAGALGSIDANTGDELLGWDTDQFPTNIYLTTYTMLSVLKYGGFKTGGVNFDAKVRRESFEPIDLFYAHIGGMDAFARGLKIAAAIRKDGRLAEFVKNRYASWDIGHRREDRGAGKPPGFKRTEAYMLKKGEVTRASAAARNSWKTSSTKSGFI